MSKPRIKRQFAGSSADPAQRQITSFFCSRGSAASATSNDEVASFLCEAQAQAQAQAPHHQPLLPASVQANLLSVGMRIRKSVPEGYKTCGGPGAFGVWTAADASNSNPSAAVVPQRSAQRASSRELVPFCGINKVGGLATQPAFTREVDDDDDDDDDDDYDTYADPNDGVDVDDEDIPDAGALPELTLSQESVGSNTSEPSRKRLYTENEPPEPPTMLAQPRRGWDEQVSPRSSAPSEWQLSRVMAVPRARVVRKGVWPRGFDRGMVLPGDEDFEEAEFLDFGEGIAHEMDIS
ncbi:hypothetical protein E4U41_000802 [Claviceps citrina]|nr:hypothetical protein E4U41_000802 [Claviceps citrina]